MFDIRQTKNYADYLSQTGWIVEEIDGVYYYIKKLPFIGCVIKVQRPEKINYEDINLLCKKYRAIRTIIEPVNEYQVSSIEYQGFKLSKTSFLPTKTLQIDLTQSKKQILKNFKSDVKSALKHNSKLIINITNDLNSFHIYWQQNTKSRFLLSSKKELIALHKSFRENCVFLTTKDFSAGAIFLKANNNAYYWKAFTSPKGRKELAQYKLVWEGILWSKKKEARVFDFEGIYDERFPLKNWKGFSHFKKSFGGMEVEYPGTFVKNKLL